MIQISLVGIGKRFGRSWILREYSDTFSGGEMIGIKGRNGSGKSTLLRLLCSQLTPSRGKVDITIDGKEIPVADRYKYVSWTGPYIEIVEELSIVEFLEFHFQFKPLLSGIKLEDIPRLLELDHVRNRKLMDCSSGMRQRVLLASALYADTPLLMLDEPTVTLDADAVEWFHTQLGNCRRDRLVFVASNDAGDLRNCVRAIEM
jgi:ABC-type multidrug transport system ATPase subunit